MGLKDSLTKVYGGIKSTATSVNNKIDRYQEQQRINSSNAEFAALEKKRDSYKSVKQSNKDVLRNEISDARLERAKTEARELKAQEAELKNKEKQNKLNNRTLKLTRPTQKHSNTGNSLFGGNNLSGNLGISSGSLYDKPKVKPKAKSKVAKRKKSTKKSRRR